MTEHIVKPPSNQKSNNKYVIMLIIAGAIIVAQAVKIYLDHQEKTSITQVKEDTEDQLAETMQRLNDIRTELEEKITEIEQLGGNVEELERVKAEIEQELADTRARDQRSISRLQRKVTGYETLLKAKDEEIEQLKSINDELLTENTTLKTEKNELSDSITQINQSKEELISQVNIASQLRAEDISVLAVNRRGKERESPFRKNQINTLKVVFNIAENNVAPIEGKNILIRIVDPNGQVVFDVDRGSGTFMLNNKEEFYTASQEILFDNSRQQLTFDYDKGSEYEEGQYIMEVYTDDYLMGRESFVVK
jgi:cell division protein ZapB